VLTHKTKTDKVVHNNSTGGNMIHEFSDDFDAVGWYLENPKALDEDDYYYEEY
jgi:hypothetical protein